MVEFNSGVRYGSVTVVTVVMKLFVGVIFQWLEKSLELPVQQW